VTTPRAAEQERLFVIVPCFNEEDSVEAVVEEVLAHAPRLTMPVAVIAIDDGSTDGTRARIEALAGRDARVIPQINTHNLGLGASVMKAYGRIPDGSWVTVLPGDGEIVFGASIDALLALRHDKDLILGYLQNPVVRPFGRRLASHAFSVIARSVHGLPYRYLNGMKLYRIDVFRGLTVRSLGHAYTAELIAKAQLRDPSLRIGEAPFAARGRGRGRSKAIHPLSVLQAVHETVVGLREVSRFRAQIIRKESR
jgi:glycosyltransferase involved in cell wall biosynthesis